MSTNFENNIKSSKFPISINFANPLRKTPYPLISPKITKNFTKQPKMWICRMGRAIFDCLKHAQDTFVVNVIPSQNTAFMSTPALLYLVSVVCQAFEIPVRGAQQCLKQGDSSLWALIPCLLYTVFDRKWNLFPICCFPSYAWLLKFQNGPMTSTGWNIKWDHFEILAPGHWDIHSRTKKSLLIKDLKPLNKNVGGEKLFSTSLLYIFQQT